MPFDDARGHAIVQGRAQPCAKPARQNPQIDAGIQNMASGFSHRQLSHSRSVDVLHPIGCSPTASHTAHIGRAWRCLLRACRRSYEVRVHERIGYRAGTGRRGDHPKRAMPKLHRHQATRAAGVSISPSVALPQHQCSERTACTTTIRLKDHRMNCQRSSSTVLAPMPFP